MPERSKLTLDSLQTIRVQQVPGRKGRVQIPLVLPQMAGDVREIQTPRFMGCGSALSPIKDHGRS